MHDRDKEEIVTKMRITVEIWTEPRIEAAEKTRVFEADSAQQNVTSTLTSMIDYIDGKVRY